MGNVRFIKWLVKRGVRQIESCSIAAYNGQIEMLNYFIDDSSQNWEKAMNAAATGGSIPAMEWLRLKKNIPLTIEAMSCAAFYGRINVIEYLRHENINWTTDTTATATENGQLDTLKWLVEKGCPMRLNRCVAAAARHGEKSVIAWLYRGADPAQTLVDFLSSPNLYADTDPSFKTVSGLCEMVAQFETLKEIVHIVPCAYTLMSGNLKLAQYFAQLYPISMFLTDMRGQLDTSPLKAWYNENKVACYANIHILPFYITRFIISRSDLLTSMLVCRRLEVILPFGQLNRLLTEILFNVGVPLAYTK